MPDHVHVVVWFPEMKSGADDREQMEGMDCQNFEDRMAARFFRTPLTKGREFREKADYILANPVRAGLVEELRTGHTCSSPNLVGTARCRPDAAARRPYLFALSNSSTSGCAS